MVTPNKVYAGSNRIDLTKDTVYIHPVNKVCNYSVDTSAFATASDLASLEKRVMLGSIGLPTPVLGARIRIGGFDYMIVHITSSIVYAILEKLPFEVQFSSAGSSIYAGSTIATLCETWYSNNVPESLKNLGIFSNASTSGVISPCFIPSYADFNGGFQYFERSLNPKRQTPLYVSYSSISDANGYSYWTSTANGSYLYGVDSYGAFLYAVTPTSLLGFRPCLAISVTTFS